METLRHPGAVTQAENAGTLSLARSDPSRWSRHRCEEGGAFDSVEWHPRRGLLTLTGSAAFATGDMSQTHKRDVQRAVTAVILAYNESVAKGGEALPSLTIHENHLVGDGKVHPIARSPASPTSATTTTTTRWA